MWSVSYLYLCITWFLSLARSFSTSSVLDVDSCQLRGHFKLNGMYHEGDLILGGLFAVHFLTVFPELSFTSEPEQPYCGQWVDFIKQLSLHTHALREKKKKQRKTKEKRTVGLDNLFNIFTSMICVFFVIIPQVWHGKLPAGNDYGLCYWWNQQKSTPAS